MRVFAADHTYTTLRLEASINAATMKSVAAEKLGIKDETGCHDEDLALVELKSTGERIVFDDEEVSIPTGLSLNGRLFVALVDHMDALVRHLQFCLFLLSFPIRFIFY